MDILCKDCIESDPSEIWRGYKIYCSWYRQYVDPQDTCSRAMKRGYYVSTAICDVLGIDQMSDVPNSIKNFSINVLQKDKKYEALLKKYDQVGSKVADAIMVDRDRQLCEVIYQKYLVVVTNHIKVNKNEQAIALYENMVNSLADYFALNQISDNEYTSGRDIYELSRKAKK